MLTLRKFLGLAALVGAGVVTCLASRGLREPASIEDLFEGNRDGVAVLLIDMQEQFLGPLDFRIENTPAFRERYGESSLDALRRAERKSKQYHEMVRRQAAALEEYRRQGFSVILVEYGYNGIDGIVEPKDTYQPLKEAIRGYRRSWKYIKTVNNAFENGILSRLLKERGVGKVILMGLDYPFCVHESAEGAQQAGFEVEIRDDLTIYLEGSNVMGM